MFADFRSDTVTKPTDDMRIAMKNCIVGDDVIGDDLTVKELENYISNIFNKDASLFVPSGTMSNLLSVMVHCEMNNHCGGGKGVIIGHKSHMNIYEQGGLSYIARAHAVVKQNQIDGTIDLSDIEMELKAHTSVENDHYYEVALVCIENTHNQCGGCVLNLNYMNDLGELCEKFNVPLHIDGARIFNAAVALNCSVKDISASASSISVCLSKGLGAPIGSCLVGDHNFIRRARRLRKMIGGSMRQVGTIAAPALIAVKEISKLLPYDHIRAQKLVSEIRNMKNIRLMIEKVDSNLVFVNVGVESTDKILNELKNNNILTSTAGPGIIRFAFHHQITDNHVDKLINILKHFDN